MTTTVYRPLHDWQRHYPTAKRIAAALLADPAVLTLRTRRLEVDVRARFGVCPSTARTAIGMARAAVAEAAEECIPTVHVEPVEAIPPGRSGYCSCCDVFHGRQRSSYCVSCHSAYMRQWRKTHPLTPEQRKKDNARSQASVALRRGRIVRQPCEACGAHAEMHHDNYDKPLDVRWLCRPCHMAHHAAEKAA